MKTKFSIHIFILAVFLCSCRFPDYLSEPEDIGVNRYGAEIFLQLNNQKNLKGELLSVEQNSVYLLTDSADRFKLVIIPVNAIERYKALYARPKNYEPSIPLLSLLSFSNGLFAIFTLPLSLITTLSIVNGAELSVAIKGRNFDELKMFSRYPQGIPKGINLKDIKR
ncbi:MAG: hypothetical protein NTW49_06265 [Bacteroidia bacterium]|nr:hypothetical protein [Bacteroidia bacterium]